MARPRWVRAANDEAATIVRRQETLPNTRSRGCQMFTASLAVRTYIQDIDL
jgi:hypothetical protein